MQDHELDELLRHGAVRPAAAAITAASELAEQTRTQADVPSVPTRPAERRWWSRRPVLVGGLLAGAVVLSGAGSLAAYQMSVPPYQTIPDGVQRLDTPIPIDYARADGATVRCLVFMEFQNLSRTQLQRIDRAVAGEDWTPERQRQLLGRAPAAGPPSSQSEALPRVLFVRLHELANGVVPDLAEPDFDHPSAAEKPELNGYGASCREIQK